MTLESQDDNDCCEVESNLNAVLRPIKTWFDHQGWHPLPFQKRTWKAHLQGLSGLIQVPTGSGKTYAAVMGPIAQMLATPNQQAGIRLLYITPLRALSRDLAVALQLPIDAMGWSLRVGIRNGDTANAERSRQIKKPPEILITTPESLCVLLAGRHCEALVVALFATEL